jgi:methylmalonyl-CoA mutase N-terminal domain/subunit
VLLYETQITVPSIHWADLYVESLTSDYEERSERRSIVSKRWGMAVAVEQGYAARVNEGRYEAQKKFEAGEILRVGSNKFVMEEKPRKRNLSGGS